MVLKEFFLMVASVTITYVMTASGISFDKGLQETGFHRLDMQSIVFQLAFVDNQHAPFFIIIDNGFFVGLVHIECS